MNIRSEAFCYTCSKFVTATGLIPRRTIHCTGCNNKLESTRWTINAAALRDLHLGETLSNFRKLWYTWNEPPFEDDDLED